MSNLSLLDHYTHAVQEGLIEQDPAQIHALTLLTHLIESLESKKGVLQRLGMKTESRKGIYIWGPVGRGKTFLMDLFVDAIPTVQKQRWHFHRFMQWLHHTLKDYHGQKDPLFKIAKALGKEIQVLCFDEFVVQDIGDAMLLGGFIQALFEAGVVLVATSNCAPAMLYRNGLQRALFLPAIAALEAHTTVFELKGPKDYRLQFLKRHLLYFCPITEQTEANLQCLFQHLACGHSDPATTIEVEGRIIPTRQQANGVIWFSFEVLCQTTRSVADYIALAKKYHTIILSGVPRFTKENEDTLRRFIHFIDECYDRKVKVIISSTTPIVELYWEGLLSFEFERTKSRLFEMQSGEYLALPHLP